MTFMSGLQCHLCGTKFPAEALWVCDQCLGPLEVAYDYAAAREALTRDTIEKRGRNGWRVRGRVAVPGTVADYGRAPDRIVLRLHSARSCRSPGQATRAPGALHQGRFGQPS